ncbi:fe2+ transport protein 1-like protein [Cinnamomum micranthum f. kanehirae]|uniref:Fe2+ transport protein 1-like protein n=1 Tax=Cinnamomum micranthum f. kanehirae TaxID=337451 RepID=A0A443NTU0_9MAGN|nr:fe2+ transport protein 1-like protein [Cinnamomum micranthum f. kanehirae]
MAAMKVTFLILILLTLASQISCNKETGNSEKCNVGSAVACYNKPKALTYKFIAIASIFVTSMLGVCLPLFTRSVPALSPDKDLFVIVKAFASGVILATGYMHVMPDSFNALMSECLPENPWRKFPFTTFVAMLSAVLTLMVDSFATAFYKKSGTGGAALVDSTRCGAIYSEERAVELNGHDQRKDGEDDTEGSRLLRYRVIAQVLEMGIVVHSVVIGLSLGTDESPCTIKPLIAALCFHQLFEGMGLGGCILQAEYGMKTKAMMVFFFAFTTPFGIALGIGLSNVYSPDSPTALIVVGLLNASAAGLLNYMALVDLLGADFMRPKLQNNIKLQIWSYIAVFLGAGGMSVMAIWA